MHHEGRVACGLPLDAAAGAALGSRSSSGPALRADRACVCPATGLNAGDAEEKSRRKTQFLPLRGALTGQQNAWSANRWPVGAGLLPAPGEAELLVVASVRDGGNRGARVTPGLETAPPRGGAWSLRHLWRQGRAQWPGCRSPLQSTGPCTAPFLGFGPSGCFTRRAGKEPTGAPGRELSAAPVQRVFL